MVVGVRACPAQTLHPPGASHFVACSVVLWWIRRLALGRTALITPSQKYCARIRQSGQQETRLCTGARRRRGETTRVSEGQPPLKSRWHRQRRRQRLSITTSMNGGLRLTPLRRYPGPPIRRSPVKILRPIGTSLAWCPLCPPCLGTCRWTSSIGQLQVFLGNWKGLRLGHARRWQSCRAFHVLPCGHIPKRAGAAAWGVHGWFPAGGQSGARRPPPRRRSRQSTPAILWPCPICTGMVSPLQVLIQWCICTCVAFKRFYIRI